MVSDVGSHVTAAPEIEELLVEFDAAALELLPVGAPGEELIEHEVYVDLNNPGHGPFVALRGQVSGTGNRIVAQKDLDATTWDHLVRYLGHIAERAQEGAASSDAS